MEVVQYEASCGAHIKESAIHMVDLARKTGKVVEMDFNGITITSKGVDLHSLYDNILIQYNMGCDKRSIEAADKRRAYDATPEGKADVLRKKEEKIKRDKLRAEPMKTFSLKDKELWDASVANNKDGYGRAGHMYAARWAWMVEQEMAKGEDFLAVVDKASHDADIEGITGFMYGRAVSILSQVWVHGEELRQWHNLDTQIAHEGGEANKKGGVLNPALLSIG